LNNRIEENISKLILILKDRNETVSTMESCTGGFLASKITDNESGSSEIFKFGLVTYSNEFKIKNGINPDTIEKYTVYSNEVSIEMAKQASNIADSNWGIGITGQIGKIDLENPGSKPNIVYYSIFNKDNDVCNSYEIHCDDDFTKKEKKEIIVLEVMQNFLNMLK